MKEEETDKTIEGKNGTNGDAAGHHETRAHAEGHEEHKKKKKKEEPLEQLKTHLLEKEKEINELKERVLYQQAEFENFKKLKAKEKQGTLRFGNERLIKDLLPIIDNLERAIEHGDKTDDTKSVMEGVRMTLNGLLKVLEQFHVTRVEAVGKPFDPNVHEAVMHVERNEDEPGTVAEEFQKGYLLDGRLLRPSMVSVVKGPESE